MSIPNDMDFTRLLVAHEQEIERISKILCIQDELYNGKIREATLMGFAQIDAICEMGKYHLSRLRKMRGQIAESDFQFCLSELAKCCEREKKRYEDYPNEDLPRYSKTHTDLY